MQTLLQMTQAKIDKATEEYSRIYTDYHMGLITAHEFRDKIVAVSLPDSIPGIIDPATGLRHK